MRALGQCAEEVGDVLQFEGDVFGVEQLLRVGTDVEQGRDGSAVHPGGGVVVLGHDIDVAEAEGPAGP
jgi:hypothetical protein